MRTCEKLLLLALVAISTRCAVVNLDNKPCSFKEDWMVDDWKHGHDILHPDMKGTEPLKEEIGNVTTYKQRGATEPYLACKEEGCCYNRKYVCGFEALEYYQTSYRPAEETCGITVGFHSKEGCPENYDCRFGVCCPSEAAKQRAAQGQCPKESHLCTNFHSSQGCKPQELSGKQFCFDIYGAKTNFAKYYMIPDSGKESYKMHCCEHDKGNAHCPLDTFPALLQNEQFTFDTDEGLKCPDKHYKAKSLTGKGFVCCPNIAADYKDRLTVVLDTTTQDVSKIKECTDDDSCGEKELCLKSFLQYDPNEKRGYDKKFCYPFPKCATGEDAQLVSKSPKPKLQECDDSNMCQGQTPMFCQDKAICCPLNCPYYDTKIENEPVVVLSDNDVCPTGLMLYDHPFLKKICCRVDQDKMCPEGQLPVLPNADKTCPVNTKKNEKGLCCSIFHSKDLLGIDTEGIKSCSNHKACDMDKEFCGESQFALGLNLPSLIGTPSHCYPRPTFKNADLQLGSQTGLKACTKDSDCGGGDPVHCAEYTINKKKGTGKVCFEKPCPFGLPVLSDTCTTYSNCTTGGCFNLIGEQNHCCPFAKSFLCPGDVYPVPGKDGSPFGDCDETAKKHKFGDQEFCCPILHHEIRKPTIYNNDTTLEKTPILLVNYEKSCTTNSDCAADEFCGNSTRGSTGDVTIFKPDSSWKHCYKKPLCEGDYTSAMHKENQWCPALCKNDGECTVVGEDPRYCNKNDKLCCAITTEMCPYYTKQKRDSSLQPCHNDDCVHFGEGIHGLHCVNIPRLGKRCCDIDPAKLCPHQQAIGLHDFQKVQEGDCEKFGMFSYGPDKYCCRHFQYAEIDNYLAPINLDGAKTGEGGKEMVCKDHSSCPEGHFCGKAVYSTKQKGKLPKPNPEVSFCFPLPTHENAEAMKADTVGLQFCKTTTDCKGEKDAVVCEKGAITGGEITETAMCFQKKCPFGMASLTPKNTCSDTSLCSNSVCTPIGSTKHCCPVDEPHLCYQKHLPIVKGENEKCPDGTVKHPNPAYTTLCCSRFVSFLFLQKKLTVFAANDDKQCSNHKECTNDKFCGQSSFAYNGSTYEGGKHCYTRPIFEGVAASLNEIKLAVKLCGQPSDCKADNPVICTKATVEDKPVEMKFCFEKACSFGDKSTKPHVTCKTKNDCGSEYCVQTFENVSHCCKKEKNDILCLSGEPPVMGENNNPHGKCDAKISYQETIDKKKYCCPFMVHYTGKSHLQSNSTPCSTTVQCKPDEFCGESARIDKQPMLKSSKHCYSRPVCSKDAKNNVKYALLREDTLVSCADSINCNGLVGEEPHFCKEGACCELKCPYWSKVVAPHAVADCDSTSTCPENSQCSLLDGFKQKKCCHVDSDKMCPGDQLPVLDNGKAPTKCPDGSLKHPHVDGVCCATFQSVDVVDQDNKPAIPDKMFDFCRTHKECSDADEFCGYSEFTTKTATMRGKLAHCYKVPALLPKKLRPTLLRTIGLFSCKGDAECTEATGPVLCKQINSFPGKGFCYESPCPFDLLSKNTTGTCSSYKDCDEDSLCTSVHDSVKHCCPVGRDYRCSLFQLPYMQSEVNGCKDGSVPHNRKQEVCCQYFIYKDLAPSFELKALTNDKECSSHSECAQNEFCGESTLSKMSDRLQGTRRHCYPRPLDSENIPASMETEVNLLRCETDLECKTTNPASCAPALINKKQIPGVKMCFEKQCPYGAPPLDTQLTCQADGDCELGSLCTKVTGSASHCCPVADEYKCYYHQLPYVKPKATECEDKSGKHPTKGELCCQKFILKDFGQTTPLFAGNKQQQCGAHMDCEKDEFCGESELYKMAGKVFGSPKHCYKRPTFDGVPAMVNRDIGLALCSDVSQCKASHPVVCEGINVGDTPVKGMRACFEKPCPLGGSSKSPSTTCSGHEDCSAVRGLCVPVFGELQNKYCCKPDNKHRCYGSQLPYVLDGTPIEQCKDGADAKNGYCCQHFISKTFKEEVKANNNNQECTAHKQCNNDEFCGPSTLAKMDSMVIGEPHHCFKIPKSDGDAGEIAMLNKTVGILTCKAAADCAPFATHAVICKEAKGVNLCFEKQCPFGATPADPAETCTNDSGCNRALCTKVIGEENHCCPVESSLKCFKTQLPYQKGGSKCEDEQGVQHPTRPELCCRQFINRLLGDENAVFAKDNEKECSSSDDCKENEFCGESTVYKMDSLLIGNPKHCYPMPEFEESTPITNDRGLVKCGSEGDCKTTNPTVCASGKIAEVEIKGLKICYEKACPFGEPSNSSLFCENHSGCTDGVCSKVFSSSKHCCPIGADFTCHDATPFPQYPYIKDDAKGCEDGSEKHPKQAHLCCQKFAYKGFGEAAVFEPTDASKTCESEKDCNEGEFCGESLLLKMDTRGTPKHCFTRPVLDGNIATLSSGELVKCTEPSVCPGEKVSTCDVPTLPSKSLSGVSICYEANCPLWPVGTAIDRTKSVICKDQQQCGDFDKTHCVNLYKKEKHCCPVDAKNLCPGGVLPLLDQADKVLENCDSKTQYQNPAGLVKSCCDIPISMKYYEAGVEVESKDATKICEKNAICDKGFFCGLSVTKSGKTVFENKMKHCYKEPTGAGGILREDEGSDITPCESHDQCNKAKGEYCNKELGKEFKKGICHLAKCPLAKALTKNTYVTCKSNADCGSELCHPISGNERGCCTIDAGNYCPAGLIPPTVGEKSCIDTHFQFQANGVDVCCRKLISKTINTAGTAWPLLKTKDFKEIIKAMDDSQCSDKKTCSAGFYCDVSAALDGSTVEKEVKHCYPEPATHGKSIVGPPKSIKTCKDSKDCDGANGEICDKLIHELDASISKSTGVCSQFFCPLSTSSLVSRPPSFKQGTSVCDKLDECSSDNKECHPVGIKEKFKGCCGVDKEFLCPGGLFPRSYIKKMISSEHFKCEDGFTYPYEFGHDHFKPKDTARCCPRVISRDIYLGTYTGEHADITAPTEQTKICKNHDECGDGYFCGESMLEEHSDSGRELRVNGQKVFHCYEKPKCAGTTVLLKDIGLKTCSQKQNTCGDNEVCDFGLADSNGHNFPNTGVCCHYNCKASYPEIKENDPGKAGKICSSANCDEDTGEQGFCDEDSGGNENEINICEKTETPGKYRLCTYQRDPVSCSGDLLGTMRLKNTYDLVGCNHDDECRVRRVDADDGDKIRPRCVAPSKELKHFNYPKICCKADLCSDMYTDRKNEKECKVVADCPSEIYGNTHAKSNCESDSFEKDTTKHCCPYAEPAENSHSEVQYPYRINKKCTKLADCIGERRFCDPVTEQCMYNIKMPTDIPDKSCTIEDKDCGDKRIVCMTTELVSNGDSPTCYAHPLDECRSNSECTSKGGFCAPAQGTTEADYDLEFRICYTPVPKDAKVIPDQVGLQHCQNDNDCKDPDYTCDNSRTDVALKAGFGFCKQRIEIKCHGIPLIKYVGGKVSLCTKNAECDDSHFCDLQIEKRRGWSENQGICCSKPTDCAGESSSNEIGLKICTDDSFCNADDGEICDKEITKPAGSNWKGEEGVCCKMNCPKFSNPEAIEEDLVQAGAVCKNDNCQSDEKTFKSCVSPSNNVTNKERCCSYKRNKALCPADTLGAVRDGLDAKPCTSNGDCPSDAGCMEGWCCKQSFCPDGFTLKMKQTICSESTVDADCGQPNGASATCEDGHCCPTMYSGTIQKPFITDHKCDSASNCPRPMMYCHDKLGRCVHFGSRMELKTDKPCESDNSTCPEHDGLPGVCVFPDANEGTLPVCFTDPLAQKVNKPQALKADEPEEDYEKSKAGLIIGIVAVIIGILTLIALGLFIYFKFTQRRTKKRKEEAARKAQEEREKSEKQGSEVSAREPSQKEPEGPKLKDVPVDPNCAPLAPQFIAL